jgi:hypothetical protein
MENITTVNQVAAIRHPQYWRRTGQEQPMVME